MAVSEKMSDSLDVSDFFEAIINQQGNRLRSFFKQDATVIWVNTNEEFTVDEYIRANCEYPGEWKGIIEDIQCYSRFDDYNRVIVIAKVWDNKGIASRVVSFIELDDTESEHIQTMTEYWSDIGDPPKWRQALRIGKRYQD